MPYDARYPKDTGHLVSGLSTKNHRSKSPGHDPLLNFFVGVRDLMNGHIATYFDSGKAVRVPTQNDPVGLIEAFGIVVKHLFSDVATPSSLWLQPPSPGSAKPLRATTGSTKPSNGSGKRSCSNPVESWVAMATQKVGIREFRAGWLTSSLPVFRSRSPCTDSSSR